MDWDIARSARKPGVASDTFSACRALSFARTTSLAGKLGRRATSAISSSIGPALEASASAYTVTESLPAPALTLPP